MNRCHEYAQELLTSAKGDGYIVAQGTKDLRILDSIVGFHAQQAVEKALKAVIANRDLDYPLTHDLRMLNDMVSGLGMRGPVESNELVKLTPYAAVLRYGATPPGMIPLDRRWALACVERTLDWAARMIEPSP